MKLCLVLIILLFVILTDGAQPQKCFDGIDGYCRKRCKPGEISEVECPHEKMCCVNEEEKKTLGEHTPLFKPLFLSLDQDDVAESHSNKFAPYETTD
ncbi:beta-defensin 128-like [Perognathus longimembris pacificus]|uniref:beta-defensin 128-like n=1 Tax=Perognathus longimembris pacificus TaxID=214514 RepID=UPI002019BE3A|nr:beta-defensin 128-like [Perognathus longimembris pacificus]